MEFTGLNLNVTWFILIGVLFTGYAILDGFDLGVGALHLFTDTDEERRIMINAIGPVWDGNEVWLVTGGGALFAAFPDVYATVFSGYYSAFMLLLAVLIFRAVAIEFRSKQPMKWWRRMWDVAFSLSSIFITLLMGITLGNTIVGVPVGVSKDFSIDFVNLLNPYAVLVGITTVTLFMMHGSIYAVMKTDGEMQIKIRSWVNNSIIFFVISYVTTTMVTLLYMPHMSEPFKHHPAYFGVALVGMLAIANIPREIHHKREFLAFISSCASIASLMALFAIGIFPNLVMSSISPDYHLTIYNAASSQKTLSIMLTFAVIGIPFVLAYTVSIYWIFRGKVHLDSMSY
jgi:cytochrome bd ubiquinol oxidase subunit II